jgi:hypothetical protein
MAFQPLRTQLALGFRRPTADLPALRPKGWVADHFLPGGHVLQQPIGRLALSRASQIGTPLDESFPRWTVPTTFPETVAPTEADTRLAEESSRRLTRLLGKRRRNLRLSVQADDEVEQSVAIPVPAFRLLTDIL